jgi:hypothetical protein
MLIRMGAEAYITMGNKKRVDIRVIYQGWTKTIDVKAVRGYSSWIVNNVEQDDSHYVVLVCYNNKFEDVTSLPDVFVLPSDKILSLSKVFKDQKRVFKGDITQYKNSWNLFFDNTSK